MGAALETAAPQRCGLTLRQRECFDAIASYIDAKGCAPSYDDLMDALKLRSRGRIHELVYALQERGWITVHPHLTRSIAIVGDGAGPAYTLPDAVEAKLRAFCIATGEDAAAFVADAVTLMLDDAEPRAVE